MQTFGSDFLENALERVQKSGIRFCVRKCADSITKSIEPKEIQFGFVGFNALEYLGEKWNRVLRAVCQDATIGV